MYISLNMFYIENNKIRQLSYKHPMKNVRKVLKVEIRKSNMIRSTKSFWADIGRFHKQYRSFSGSYIRTITIYILNVRYSTLANCVLCDSDKLGYGL